MPLLMPLLVLVIVIGNTASARFTKQAFRVFN